MLHRNTNLNRLIATSLAAAAITATLPVIGAGAAPTDRPAVTSQVPAPESAAGGAVTSQPPAPESGGPAVTSQVPAPESDAGGGAADVAPIPAPAPDVPARNLTAPDQVDRGSNVTAPAVSLSAPDQVDRVAGAGAPAAPEAPTLNPAPQATDPPDDGVATGVLIAIGVAMLMAVGGIALIRRRTQPGSLALGRTR